MSTARSGNSFPGLAHSLVICAVLIYGPGPAFAQVADSSSEQTQEAKAVSGKSLTSDKASEDQQQPSAKPVICGLGHLGQCIKDLGHDQAGIWTSPLRIRTRDAYWLAPFAGATAVALHFDAQAQQELGIDQTRIDASNAFSDFGLYGSIGGAAGLYLLGSAKHNERWSVGIFHHPARGSVYSDIWLAH